MYDKIEHTKKMGIVYSANVITDVSAGGTAQRLGVQQGWKILAVNGAEMPSSNGAEQTIHARPLPRRFFVVARAHACLGMHVGTC